MQGRIYGVDGLEIAEKGGVLAKDEIGRMQILVLACQRLCSNERPFPTVFDIGCLFPEFFGVWGHVPIILIIKSVPCFFVLQPINAGVIGKVMQTSMENSVGFPVLKRNFFVVREEVQRAICKL